MSHNTRTSNSSHHMTTAMIYLTNLCCGKMNLHLAILPLCFCSFYIKITGYPFPFLRSNKAHRYSSLPRGMCLRSHGGRRITRKSTRFAVQILVKDGQRHSSSVRITSVLAALGLELRDLLRDPDIRTALKRRGKLHSPMVCSL